MNVGRWALGVELKLHRVTAVSFLCGLLCTRAWAGDAVVIGYNADGVWTAVTYYGSSTPKGGNDYKDKTHARDAAVRDLKRRGGGEMVRSNVLDESDQTGYVAVARGQTNSGADLTVVGRGESQADADAHALAQLNRSDAKSKQKIVYRYFSYGADSG